MGDTKKKTLIPVLRLFVFKWACKHFGYFLRILVLGEIDTDPPSGRFGARLQGWRCRSQLTRATWSYTNCCLPTTHPFCYCPKENCQEMTLECPLPQEWHHTSWNLRSPSFQLTAFSSLFGHWPASDSLLSPLFRPSLQLTALSPLFRHWPAPSQGSRHTTHYVSPQNRRPPIWGLSTSSNPIWAF